MGRTSGPQSAAGIYREENSNLKHLMKVIFRKIKWKTDFVIPYLDPKST